MSSKPKELCGGTDYELVPRIMCHVNFSSNFSKCQTYRGFMCKPGLVSLNENKSGHREVGKRVHEAMNSIFVKKLILSMCGVRKNPWVPMIFSGRPLSATSSAPTSMRSKSRNRTYYGPRPICRDESPSCSPMHFPACQERGPRSGAATEPRTVVTPNEYTDDIRSESISCIVG